MTITPQNTPSHLTLIEAIYEHSINNPERLAYGCISSEGTIQSALTYRDLISRSENVAAELLRLCDPGDRAMLLFHGGNEFIVSFLGSLIAGVIPVPGYPVRVPASSAQPARNFARLVPIISNAGPKVALTTRPVVDRRAELSAAEPVFSTLKWIAVEEIPDQRLGSRPQVAGTDLAFLQYTSGSTSLPKGVMVSHNNLVSVLRDMNASWPNDDSSVMITWAPVFHDMGLIHGILFPLYFGFPVYTLSAASVLQQPKRWLDAITRLGGTHSSGPNFIFDLCLKRISEHEVRDLNLSTLSACLTGAEAVRHKTLLQFREAFALGGLRPDAIQPGYGLAEFTLTVSGVDVGSTPRTVHLDAAACEQGRVVLRNAENGAGTRSFVNCGWTHVGSDIRIVEPKSRRECQPFEIGEIWVSGDNLTQGYWGNAEATEETMRARLIDGSGPYLRTGDLGFVIDRGLYIAGRLKDLIIIRGRNLYPHDIEATVEESLPEVRVGRCCAFSIEREEGEALVIVAEVDRVQRHTFDADEVFARLREEISVRHEAELFDAVFVRTGTFPLTSSGKAQRQRARQEYLDGTLQAIARIRKPEPAGDSSLNELYQGRVAEVRAQLNGYISKKLSLPAEKLSTSQSFQRLGLDSFSMIEMVLDLEEFTGQPLETSIVFEHPSIEELSAYVARVQLASQTSVATLLSSP
ncbi:MAG: Beta-ketoacyl synthase [Acidobacteria bacterium]|nr:Beta-ketoacyl synthase [Acidobacteriota bacterium]